MRSYVAAALAAIVVLAATTAAAYEAPKRSITQVAYAITAVRPKIAPALARSWAAILIDVAAKHNFDPLSGWAIIAHESRWRPSAVGGGKDIGLAQVRYTQSRRCKGKTDAETAAKRQSAACQVWREALFDPAINMAQMGVAITEWRKTCKRITGKALLKHVLQGYGGYSHWPARPILCGRRKVKGRWRDLPVPREVQKILKARRAMIRELNRNRIR